MKDRLLQHPMECKGTGVLHGQGGAAFLTDRTFVGEGGRDQLQG